MTDPQPPPERDGGADVTAPQPPLEIKMKAQT